MLTEKASLYSVLNTIPAQTLTTSDITGVTIDLQGFNDAFFTFNVGANGGTIDGSNFVLFQLFEGDESDMSDETAVTDTGSTGGYSTNANGTIASVAGASAANKAHKSAYTGIKRYIRVKANVTGTVSLPASGTVNLGSGLAPQA